MCLAFIPSIISTKEICIQKLILRVGKGILSHKLSLGTCDQHLPAHYFCIQMHLYIFVVVEVTKQLIVIMAMVFLWQKQRTDYCWCSLGALGLNGNGQDWE